MKCVYKEQNQQTNDKYQSLKNKDLSMKTLLTILCLLLTHTCTSTINNQCELNILRDTCKLTSACLSKRPSYRKITQTQLKQLLPSALSKNIELTLDNAQLSNPTASEQRVYQALCNKLKRYQAVLNQYAYAQSAK